MGIRYAQLMLRIATLRAASDAIRIEFISSATL